MNKNAVFKRDLGILAKWMPKDNQSKVSRKTWCGHNLVYVENQTCVWCGCHCHLGDRVQDRHTGLHDDSLCPACEDSGK